ncbi:hypothetical protein DYB28_000721 [Aphanomyces astaci]|uniref:FYVE-type domain-containing protein n=1 Tax=Aphanomyces astaci TaxID=112090 RepID=A0A9X8E3L9_APHAT|nr:hypothetical protein DYB28_000721 [Aphanomyces astaci]
MAPSTRSGATSTVAATASSNHGSGGVPDVLSDREKEHFTNVARHMTQALLAATNFSQAMPWKLVYDKPFSIYRTELCGLGPCNVHAVTKLVAHIDEVTNALITTTTDSYKSMMATLSSDFVDGAVLANILTPTAENPFRYVGLKWAAFKGSVMSKDKDYILLEYVDLIEDAHGKKTAFRIMQSVDVPNSVELSLVSGRYTREHVQLVGFIYHTTAKKGELRMTYTCNMDTKGDMPIWAANSAIQSHVDKCITRTLKYIEVQRVLQYEGESFDLPQRVIPMSGSTDYCHVCEKKFKSYFRHRHSCLKCAKYVCKNCCSFKTASVPELGERQLRVCTVCVVQVRQARRGSADLHRKESLDRLLPTCLDARQKRHALDEVLGSVRHMIVTDYKLFSSHQAPSHMGKNGTTSHGNCGNNPVTASTNAAIMRRRVTVGPQQLTPALEMFKEGLPTLVHQQQQQHASSVYGAAAARVQRKEPSPDKRRSTVGPCDLKSSLAAFHHHVEVTGKAAAPASHREDEETSDDGSMYIVSSDSEGDDDSDDEQEVDDSDEVAMPRRRIALTESALRELNMHQKRSKELEKQTEANHKLANSIARQYSDSQHTSAASHSRKSSLNDLMPTTTSSSSSMRKASAGTIVLYDMDEIRDMEKLRAFQQTNGAKRRSSSSEVLANSSHPPSTFMF